ncbi:MAG: twin-arginine translocase TatA/TatE family subunit [Thermoprotei archaeon]
MVALSPADIAIIIIVALILFFGSTKLPELMRSMGRAIGEFKKGRLEAEMELQQMQQTSQPQVAPGNQQSKEDQLEQRIKELEAELERLKAQKKSQ